MAKCDLSIELDGERNQVYHGGGKVSGVVRVRADADVKCKGLVVQSGWKTHGRGNVATGTAGSQTLFAGEWRAGEQSEYRFELPIADWPPSYHGSYLSVDHYVDAQAKIPWAFDPKASVPFLMRPTCGPDGVTTPFSNATEVKGVAGCLVGIVIVIVLGMGAAIAAVAFNIIGLIVVSVIASIAFLAWLFKSFLPKYLLGDVSCELTSETAAPGDSLEGELVIRPKKNVDINAVTMHFEAKERCVSGSGSNRTTHTNTFVDKVETLQEKTTLIAGKEHRFPVSINLPADAPYSLDLDDNDLIWSATLRVDIPRWPDWKKSLPLQVVPSSKPSQPHPVVDESTPAPESFVEPPSDGITFAETARHVWSVREDREQVETLVEAVSGLTFQFEADVERRLLYGGDEDPHVYKDGYVVWAHYTDPELPLVLYVPHPLADEFEQVGRDSWRGRGTIVGWDRQHGRLQVKLEPPR